MVNTKGSLFGEKDIILMPSAYFGSVYYFSILARFSNVYIDDSESYQRQTLRNRAEIVAANGPLNLVVPAERGRTSGQPIREIKIAYHMPWQTNHWRTLVSAYKNSPYFEYYEADLYSVFQKKPIYLFDLNIEITRLIISLLNIDTTLKFTGVFHIPEGSPGDLRYITWPIRERSAFDEDYSPVTYTQVFEEKFNFIPHLSVLDLLFCEGPNSLTILRGDKKR